MAKRRRSVNVPGQNALLAVLPDKELARLSSRLEPAAMSIKDVVYEPDGPIRQVYFPLSGVFSMLVVMEDGLAVEIGTIGNEGMVGMPVFLGTRTSPTRTICQVPGEALRMRAEDLEEELGHDGALDDVLKRYNQALVTQMGYSVACNRLHSVEERMCRWLLMTHDRVGADQFPLTQEFLALMLGVRRPSVTVAAGVLQKAGLIAYARGRVVVLDRRGLEAASCECYQRVKDEFERLLG
ncbi:MAG TPA: Crp/Fnr family transcriptional regulator [Gemmataceae bacterium]|jgi:CRP-like cAMP-binding protein